ncbi:Flp family type IVb pilin [Arthrobacter sp. DNA4]|nr:Flp family type IVb pilin [Arthrobacter sp. DNA4]UTT71568.1 Flp family type IVb pilin [Arthrobacter sp. DNA4]
MLLAITALQAWAETNIRSEKGATATEYALLVGLIALVLVAGVGFFGTTLNTWFSTLGTTVSGW